MSEVHACAEIQTGWLTKADAVFQQLHDDLAASNVEEIADLIRVALGSMDPPPDPLHNSIFVMMGMAFCRALVDLLHEGEATTVCHCHRVGWLRAESLMQATANDSRHAIEEWAGRFLAHFNREHPQTGAALAAAFVRADPNKVWSVEDLARAVRMRPIRLRQEFQRRFGLRPLSYVHLVRATKAVRLCGTSIKVEAIVRELGYRSKKDFYAALRQWVGATPTEVRALSDDERRWVERQLRRRLVRGPTLVSAGERGPSNTRASRRSELRHQRAPRLRM